MIKNILKLHHRKWHWYRAGVVFIHVPKAAGTSLSTTLYGRFLGHYTATQINDFDAKILKRLPSFGTVRNPWDRCLSAFRFSKRPELNDGKTPSMDINVRKELEQFDDFSVFVHEWLKHKDVNKADYVFQEQSHFMCDRNGKTLVDFTGKVEEMKSVEVWLSKRLQREIIIPKLNQSGKSISYRDWYTPETRSLVGKIYQRDIRKFNYEF